MKMKFKKSLFGFNRKQIYDYIKQRDIRTAEILDRDKEELERLRKSEELVNEQIKSAFPMTDNPVYLQTEEELQALQGKVAELKKEVKDMEAFVESLSDEAVTLTQTIEQKAKKEEIEAVAIEEAV